MRSSNKRSRSKSNRPKPLGNIINRVFDSSGPEGKVRGTPQQIIEKYLVLARDAQLSGDRVAAENFLQHAEHYTRMLSDAQREMAREAEARQQQHQNQNNNQGRRFEQRDEGDSGDGAVNAPSDTPDSESGERQGERSVERQGEAGNRRGNRRDDRRDSPRPPREQHREHADPREAQVSVAPSQADTDSMLVETPESRAETRPESRPDQRPQLQSEQQVEPATKTSSAEAKPRKPRSAINRRAPRKPKEEGDAALSSSDSPRAAE